MTINELLPWLTLIAFIATVITAAMKYGGDKASNIAEHKEKKTSIDNIIQDIKDLKEQNSAQHREFYETKNSTIELKSDMKHLIASVDKMMMMLERRKEDR